MPTIAAWHKVGSSKPKSGVGQAQSALHIMHQKKYHWRDLLFVYIIGSGAFFPLRFSICPGTIAGTWPESPVVKTWKSVPRKPRKTTKPWNRENVETCTTKTAKTWKPWKREKLRIFTPWKRENMKTWFFHTVKTWNHENREFSHRENVKTHLASKKGPWKRENPFGLKKGLCTRFFFFMAFRAMAPVFVYEWLSRWLGSLVRRCRSGRPGWLGNPRCPDGSPAKVLLLRCLLSMLAAVRGNDNATKVDDMAHLPCSVCRCCCCCYHVVCAARAALLLLRCGAREQALQWTIACTLTVVLAVLLLAHGFLVGFPGASLSVGSPRLTRQSSVPRWFAREVPAVAMSAIDARHNPPLLAAARGHDHATRIPGAPCGSLWLTCASAGCLPKSCDWLFGRSYVLACS